jgi:hypothetical protein
MVKLKYLKKERKRRFILFHLQVDHLFFVFVLVQNNKASTDVPTIITLIWLYIQPGIIIVLKLCL